MKRNKKVIESLTLAVVLLLMFTITAFAGSTEEGTEEITKNIALHKNGTAGIISDLFSMEASIVNESGIFTASIEKTQKNIVATADGELQAEETAASAQSAQLELSQAAEEEKATKESESLESANEVEYSESSEEEKVTKESENVESANEAEQGENSESAKATKESESSESANEAERSENSESAKETEINESTKEIKETERTESAEGANKTKENESSEKGNTKKEKKTSEKVIETELTDSEKKSKTAKETDKTTEQKRKDKKVKKKKQNTQKKKKSKEQTLLEAEWENQVMAKVEEDMNIRTAPDANSELAGKFYRGDVAEVLSVEGEWTQITSGNVTGYVKNEYLVYGMDAYDLANEVCSLYATVDTDGLRLRSEPSESAEIVTLVENGKRLKVDKEANTTEGWVAVHSEEGLGYVSSQYVSVELNLGTALNAEEVAAKEARLAKEAQKTKNPALAASIDDVVLLGALIQCEAGNGSYEGMLAVGAVVMNRVRSGRFPNSISGVVYQSGQFTPALNGKVAAVLSNGVKSSCLQAAQEAIAGADNTNGATNFRSARSGHQGTLIGGNVFF